MPKFYISISVNTVSYAIVCIKQQTCRHWPLLDLLGRVPWDKVLEGGEAQESWLIFRNHLLQAQEQCIPAKRKLGENSKRPVWRKKELLDKEARTGNLSQRNGPSRQRSGLEMNLARDVKGNKKGFYRYVGDQRKTGENTGSLLHDSGSLRQK